MKRILVVLMIVVATVFSLTACDLFSAPESADALYGKIDEKMDSLESYKVELSASLKFYIGDSLVTVGSEGVGIDMFSESYGDYFYQAQKVTTTSEALDINSESQLLLAYIGGKAYVRNNVDGLDQKIFSAMSFEDFKKYFVGDEIDFGEYGAAENKEFSRNNNSTWTLKMSGYEKAFVEEICAEYGFDQLGEVSLSDVSVEIVCDMLYRIKSLELIFDFSGEENVPEMKIQLDYSNYNSVEPGEFVLDGYAEVENLAVIKDVERALDELYLNKDNEVRMESVSQVTLSSGKTTTVSENDEIVYLESGDGFLYTIKAQLSNLENDVLIEYGDNIKASYYLKGDDSKIIIGTEASSDEIAWAEIQSILGFSGFDSSRVYNVRSTADGEYVFDLLTKNSEHQGATENSTVMHSVTVKFAEDGSFEWIKKSVTINTANLGGVNDVSKMDSALYLKP